MADGFFQRLKERKLVQWSLAYAAGAFALLQGLDIVAQQFAWPEGARRGITIVLAIGFFIAVVLAWYHGERGAQKVSGTELLIVALLLAIGGGVLWRFVRVPVASVAAQAATAPQATAAPNAKTLTPAAAATDANSIAVLPFVDMSQGKDQEYFSDGLSEELLNQLAQIQQLRVIARTSSFSFKGKEVDVATIAKTLGVAHVLEGSVRKSGTQLRITAQLIRAADSSHLWSQTYDRSMDDVFKVQDEISREVVAALKLKLLPDQRIANTQRTRNTVAYDQYLLGMESWRIGGPDGLQRTLAAFERAVALDTGYANAYAKLAEAQAYSADYVDGPTQRAATIAKSLATVEHAIALAPDLPDGYAVRGLIRKRLSDDRQGAHADFKQALALAPNNVETLVFYASTLFFDGRREEAIGMSRKAVSLDPLFGDAWGGLGRQLAFAGDIPEARQALRRALELAPRSQWVAFVSGEVELRAGNADTALGYFRRAPEPFLLTGTAMVEHTRGNAPASQQALDELKTKYAVGFAYQIAQVHAWRGEKDRAFEWLNRAHDVHDAGMERLRVDPAFAGLRGDPRFAALVQQLGLPEQTN